MMCSSDPSTEILACPRFQCSLAPAPVSTHSHIGSRRHRHPAVVVAIEAVEQRAVAAAARQPEAAAALEVPIRS